ncbi:juvenile hormone esterase [Diabrotica virgifera virgifera]|uniref:Carboxylic ester hydrolase n=1 Tax=Diabrotica virgifera virgifera TaxID=50390 RepID=A0ABM5KB41_DIAVI|nr:juvenile hormone esterase [Diabrotica virgifera virgifera]
MLKILGIVLRLLAVAYCVESFVISDDYTVTVKTNNGKIKGGFGARSHANKDEILYWFRSIPFAEPPVGDLRFAAPVPKANWSGVLDVRHKAQECIQGSPVAGNEDCLYLKIYSRHRPSKLHKLPVVVWIYGGAFFEGSADFDDHRPDFLLHEDVIVAAVQYRLGYLGFMSLGDTVAPGNNGIKDQILGLKWIKENIRNFGGDPNKITIWGQSAGAASVAYLLQAKQTRGLFSKAILNSGSSLSPWSLAKDLPASTKEVAKKLKVNTGTSSTNILESLRKIDVKELQEAASSVMKQNMLLRNPLQGLVFTPVIEPNHDDAVITEYSHELLKQGKFHHVPILAGYTSLEGYFNQLTAIFRLWVAKFDLYHPQLVPNDMNLLPIIKSIIAESIKSKYFGLLPVALSTEELMRFIADTQFEKPIQEALRLYSAYTKVYAYHFCYEGPLWGRTNRTYNGVGHTEDLAYIFDYNKKGSEEDYLARERTVRLWANFIKYGDPTPKRESLLQNVIWPENSVVEKAENLKFLEINNDLTVKGLPNSDKIVFWNNLYRKYARPPYTTY